MTSPNISLDEMEIERFQRAGEYNYWTEVEINNKQYILEFNMPEQSMGTLDKLFVRVWATPTGKYHKPPDDPLDLGTSLASKRTPHETVTHKEIKYAKYEAKYNSFGQFVSEVLNEAICTIEDKAQQTQTMKDEVKAALEANKETHGNIDDKLN